MLTLLKSDRFQKEYTEFRNMIDGIENERVKKECTELLTKLVREVKQLDSQHGELLNRNQSPGLNTDTKQRIFEIRRLLSKVLSDYKESKAS